MVKRESYILVYLTAYRNIHCCKYKQYLHEEFFALVKLVSFCTRAQPTPYRASEGSSLLTRTEARVSYQIYKYYICQNCKTYLFTTFIVRFFNSSKLNRQGSTVIGNMTSHNFCIPALQFNIPKDIRYP